MESTISKCYLKLNMVIANFHLGTAALTNGNVYLCDTMAEVQL